MTRDEVRAELTLMKDEVVVKHNDKTPEKSTEESQTPLQGQEDLMKAASQAVT